MRRKDNFKDLYSKDTNKSISPVKADKLQNSNLMVLKPTNCNPMKSAEYHIDIKKEFNIKKNAISEYVNAVAQYANISKKNDTIKKK